MGSPYELFKRGGWLNQDSPKWFAEYAEIVAKELGDRAKYFITFNEPQCFIGLGHVTGEHAPGSVMSRRSNLQIAHNVMLAHGYAVQAMRSVASDLKLGMLLQALLHILPAILQMTLKQHVMYTLVYLHICKITYGM